MWVGLYICVHFGVKQAPIGTCCDNCEAHLTSTTTAEPGPNCPQTPNTQTFQFIFKSPSKSPHHNGKWLMVPSTDGPTTRWDDHLKAAKQVLTEWRWNIWLTEYSNTVPFGLLMLLPDPVLQKITYRQLGTVAKLSNGQVGWSTSRAQRHGEDVLKVLRELDTRVDAEKEREKADRAEMRKWETAERKAAKRAKAKKEWDHWHEESKAQPKAPQWPQRNKPAVFVTSSTHNSPTCPRTVSQPFLTPNQFIDHLFNDFFASGDVAALADLDKSDFEKPISSYSLLVPSSFAYPSTALQQHPTGSTSTTSTPSYGNPLILGPTICPSLFQMFTVQPQSAQHQHPCPPSYINMVSSELCIISIAHNILCSCLVI